MYGATHVRTYNVKLPSSASRPLTTAAAYSPRVPRIHDIRYVYIFACYVASGRIGANIQRGYSPIAWSASPPVNTKGPTYYRRFAANMHKPHIDRVH